MLTKQLPPEPTDVTIVVPKLLSRLMSRIMGLAPGRAYAFTLWLPEDPNSEPMWSVKDLGKIENQR